MNPHIIKEKVEGVEPDLEVEIQNILDKDEPIMELIADEDGAYEGVLDDDYEVAFERWAENHTTLELLEKYITYLKNN